MVGGTGIPSIQLAEVQLYEMELGIDNNQLTLDDLTISPNPNKGLFILNYSGEYPIEEVNIVNISGQVLYKETVNSLSEMVLDLSTETPGLYFVQIQNGKSTVTKKIIVQ